MYCTVVELLFDFFIVVLKGICWHKKLNYCPTVFYYFLASDDIIALCILQYSTVSSATDDMQTRYDHQSGPGRCAVRAGVISYLHQNILDAYTKRVYQFPAPTCTPEDA